MSQPEKPSLAGAIALVVLGLVVLVPSGLCTSVFAFGQSGMWPLALLIGGPFVLIGGALLYNGIRSLKRRKDATIDLKLLD